MKAIVCTKYGTPDVLELREVEKPTPNEDEALIKVHAASLNAADLEILRGTWSARFSGPLKPKMLPVLFSRSRCDCCNNHPQQESR